MISVEGDVHDEEESENRDPKPGLGDEGFFAEPDEPADQTEQQDRREIEHAAIRRDAQECGDITQVRPILAGLRDQKHSERTARILEERVLKIGVEGKWRA